MKKFEIGQQVVVNMDVGTVSKDTVLTVKRYCKSCPTFCGFLFVKDFPGKSFHQDILSPLLSNKKPEEWL